MDDRVIRQRARLLKEADGYMMLEMYRHALDSLDQIRELQGIEFEVDFRRGDALRHLERYEDALMALHRAFDANPENVDLLMALAWCYKRTNQLPRAITSMEQAYRIAPKEPIVLYNLSCYWSLARNKQQALSWLGRALRMDQDLRHLIETESDFDSLRPDPDFQLLVGLVQREKENG
jgi:tetratricopeptide (TPR) repeat protein